jgi:ABC-2 type transport system permease protein
VVALLVHLKLTLLRNGLRRSVWRTLGLVLGAVYALGIVAGAYAGLITLRWASTSTTAQVTVVVYTALTVGWLLLSLLVFGVDETVDPARFALLPVRARELLPGLLAAALVGVPGVATVLVALGLVVTWARTPALTVAGLLAAVLGTLTCVLLSRTATSAFASSLSSRRFRDLAVILLVVVGASFGIGANLLSRVAEQHLADPAALLTTLATVASWSPFGWAWALPGDVARADWVRAALHLVLAAALVVGLWACWASFLGRRLVEPTSGGSGSATVSGGGWVERLYPAGAAGAIATRSLRYWRRDPRHLATLASALVTPLLLLVLLGVNPDGASRLTVFVPAVLALLIGSGVASDLSLDGSALWLHVSAGVQGADDRRGRVLAALTIFLPLLVVMHLVVAVVAHAWSDLPAALGLSAALVLGGLGVGAWVGALWQWPGAVPGENPFQRGSSGGLPALASAMTVLAGTVVAGLPALVLVLLGVLGHPWIGWLALPVGVLTGLVVLRVGITQGGRRLDRRWPEVLRTVSERTG